MTLVTNSSGIDDARARPATVSAQRITTVTQLVHAAAPMLSPHGPA